MCYHIAVTDIVTIILGGNNMSNYSKTNATGTERIELHDILGLTGAEVSVNYMPAGAGVPFVHAHKQNEEIYVILEGRGSMVIDGENVELNANDFLRVSPAAKRQLSAAADSPIRYLCIQVKAGSLDEYTAKDALLG